MHYRINILNPRTRRAVQAVAYEGIAVAFIGPLLGLVFGRPITSSVALAAIMSTLALMWNYIFNWLFERWESKQTITGRPFIRRLAHSLGLEGGLVVVLVPLMAHWLNTTFLNAFVANLGIFTFFFVYAIAFTWVFDKAFELPESASGR